MFALRPVCEPVAVAGQWSGLTDLRNPGEARLLGCTADLRRLDGLLAVTVGPQCDVVEPASVVQDGEAFTIVRDALLCGDAVVRGQSGGGTVTGDDVRGALDLIGPDEVRTRHFRGTVEGRRVTLTFDRLSVDGLASGTCLISPPLRAEVVILP